MSSARFAPVTAELFARSRLEVPPASEIFSAPNLISIPRRGVIATKTNPPIELAEASRQPPPPHGDRPHKVRISLSDREFEAFGIAAVKRGVTRNQILREALNLHLDNLAADYGKTCRCLAGTAKTGCCGVSQ